MSPAPIRWAYAINQWEPNIDDFVRDEDHERALKTISACGFSGIELTAANFMGWKPWGNPNAITDRYGSVAALNERLRACAIGAVSSWVLDVSHGFEKQIEAPGVDPLDPSARERIADVSRWFAGALQELGGSILVVRPVGSAWRTGSLSGEQIRVLADTWNTAGEAARQHEVRIALHLDFLSALRLDGGLERLLDATDPELVGVTLDTGELAVAGIDPVDFYRRWTERVWHVQLKGALEEVSDAEALTPGADQHVRTAGGERAITRWFHEPSDAEDLVDLESLARALAAHDYSGWIVVETDGSPHPAKSAMLSGWYVQRVLQPLLSEGVGAR